MKRPLLPLADLYHLLALADADGLSPKGRERLEWLLHYAEGDRSVSATCRHFGIPRVTFYRLLRRLDPTRPESLEDRSRRPHRTRGTSLPPHVVGLICAYRAASPRVGRGAIAALLKREHGITASPSAVGRVIEQENLFFGNTPLHRRRRLTEPGRADLARAARVDAALEMGPQGRLRHRLRRIRSALEALQAEATVLPAGHRQLLAIAHEASREMTADLEVAFSTQHQDAPAVSSPEVLLLPLLEVIRERSGHAPSPRRQPLAIDCPPDLSVVADASLLAGLLHLLIEYATTDRPRGGDIWVRGVQSGDVVEISIGRVNGSLRREGGETPPDRDGKHTAPRA